MGHCCVDLSIGVMHVVLIQSLVSMLCLHCHIIVDSFNMFSTATINKKMMADFENDQNLCSYLVLAVIISNATILLLTNT